MSNHSNIQAITRSNERYADFFSLMAVSLLFLSLWLSMEYYTALINWMQQSPLTHFPAIIAVIILDVSLMLLFLSIGTQRTDNQHQHTFRTFKGRRHGAGSVSAVFGSWLNHMEKHNSKKHR